MRQLIVIVEHIELQNFVIVFNNNYNAYFTYLF